MKQTLSFSALGRLRFAVMACSLVVALLTMVSLVAPVRAVSDTAWSVLAVSGDASWRPAEVKVGGWRDLQVNAQVSDGAEIRTGGNGSAVVAKSLDRIEIRANTSIVVAASVSKNATQMYQSSGSATYTVEKRPAGTFSVRTPYVLAVVKGTKFDVDITNRETSVSVKEGRVGVSDQRSNDSVDVAPGERARARTDNPGLDVGRSSAAPAAPDTKAASGSAPGMNGETPADATPGSSKSSSAGAAGKGLETATEAVGKTAREATGAVGGTVSGTAKSLGGTVGDLGEAAGDVVGGLGSAIGGALGGDKGGSGGSGGGGSGGGSGAGSSGGGGSGGGSSGGGSSGGGGSGGGGGGSDGGGSDGGGSDGGGSSGGGDSGGGGDGGGPGSGGGGIGGAVGDAVGGLGGAVGGAVGGLGGALGGGGGGGLGGGLGGGSGPDH